MYNYIKMYKCIIMNEQWIVKDKIRKIYLIKEKNI